MPPHPAQLPFKFPFYGYYADAIYINANGFLSFGPFSPCVEAAFCNWATVRNKYTQYIAPLMADFNPSNEFSSHFQTKISYMLDGVPPYGNRFIVQWSNITLYRQKSLAFDDKFTFQASLWDNGDVTLNYLLLPSDVGKEVFIILLVL